MVPKSTQDHPKNPPAESSDPASYFSELIQKIKVYLTPIKVKQMQAFYTFLSKCRNMMRFGFQGIFSEAQGQIKSSTAFYLYFGSQWKHLSPEVEKNIKTELERLKALVNEMGDKAEDKEQIAHKLREFCHMFLSVSSDGEEYINKFLPVVAARDAHVDFLCKRLQKEQYKKLKSLLQLVDMEEKKFGDALKKFGVDMVKKKMYSEVISALFIATRASIGLGILLLLWSFASAMHIDVMVDLFQQSYALISGFSSKISELLIVVYAASSVDPEVLGLGETPLLDDSLSVQFSSFQEAVSSILEVIGDQCVLCSDDGEFSHLAKNLMTYIKETVYLGTTDALAFVNDEKTLPEMLPQGESSESISHRPR